MKTPTDTQQDNPVSKKDFERAYASIFTSPLHNKKSHFFDTVTTLVLGFVGLALFGLSFLGNIVVDQWKPLALIQDALVFNLANESRTNANVPELRVSPILNEAAQLKAQHMLDTGYFAHNSPDGITPWYWFNQVGYGYSHAGENLAIDFSDSQNVHQAWMNSPTHAKNILANKYSEIGIGKASGMYQGRYTTFVVQMFGSPLNNQQPVTALPAVTTVPDEVPVIDNLASAEPDIAGIIAGAQNNAQRLSDPSALNNFINSQGLEIPKGPESKVDTGLIQENEEPFDSSKVQSIITQRSSASDILRSILNDSSDFSPEQQAAIARINDTLKSYGVEERTPVMLGSSEAQVRGVEDQGQPVSHVGIETLAELDQSGYINEIPRWQKIFAQPSRAISLVYFFLILLLIILLIFESIVEFRMHHTRHAVMAILVITFLIIMMALHSHTFLTPFIV